MTPHLPQPSSYTFEMLLVLPLAPWMVQAASLSSTTTFENIRTQTSFSSTAGPYIAAYSGCWSQVYFPTVVGTVSIIINRTVTTTRTVYNTKISANGSLVIFSRTDTNEAGTVTTDGLAYPTGVLRFDSSFTWDAILPTTATDSLDPGSCCLPRRTYSPTFSHTTTAPPVQSIDPLDPEGLNYKLDFCHHIDDLTYGPEALTSLWGNRSITLDYSGCPYTYCHESRSLRPMGVIESSPVNILATITTTLSSLESEQEQTPRPALKSTSNRQLAETMTKQDESTSTPTVLSALGSSTPATRTVILANTPTSAANPVNAVLATTSASTMKTSSTDMMLSLSLDASSTVADLLLSRSSDSQVLTSGSLGAPTASMIASAAPIDTRKQFSDAFATDTATLMSNGKTNLPPLTQGTSTADLRDNIGGYIWTAVGSAKPSQSGNVTQYTGLAVRHVLSPLLALAPGFLSILVHHYV